MKQAKRLRGSKPKVQTSRVPEILAGAEGEFKGGEEPFCRIPPGGRALLAKKAWPRDQAKRRRFLKSGSQHPVEISIEEYGRLQDGGGILIDRQLREWLGRRQALLIEWLPDPLERENRELSRQISRFRAQKQKAVAGTRKGGAVTKQKAEPGRARILALDEEIRKKTPGLSRAARARMISARISEPGKAWPFRLRKCRAILNFLVKAAP